MNNAVTSSSHSKNQRNSEDILADILQTSEFSHYKPSGKKDGNQIYRNKLDEDGSRDDNPGKVLSVTGLYDHTNGTHEALYSIAKRLGVPIHTDQPVKKKATVEAVSDTTAAAKKATGYQKAMDRYSTPLDDFSFQFIKKYYNSRMIPIDRDMAEALGIRFENTKAGQNKIWIPCRNTRGKNVRSYYRVLSDNFTKLAGEKGKLGNHGKHGLPANAIVIGGNLERFVIFEGIENALTYYYLSSYEGETILACCGAGNIPAMAEFCKGATSVKVMVDGDVNDGKDYPDYTTNSFQRSLQLRRALPEGVCTLWLPERAKEDINDAHCKGEAQRWLNTLQQFKDDTVVDYLLPMLSHLDCARKFIETYHGEFLFDTRHGKTFMIRDNNWSNRKQEITNGVVTNIVPADSIMSAKLATFLEQVALSNGYDEKQQREIKSSQYRSGVKKQIEAISAEYGIDRGVWNMNPHLIGTPGKTINMLTGETYPARAEDLITQQLPAEMKRKDGALWDKCIDQWTGGDKELSRYLQKVVGVCLFGDRLEDYFFFIYGGTGTGKGTFIESIESSFGDYVRRCNLDLFMEIKDGTSQATGPRPDIIALDGAHLVICDETQEGQAFNNSVVKALTGNSSLSVRQMYEDKPRTIRITWNVLLVGNSKPVIKNLDTAMERRMIVMPFLCRFHGTKDDNQNLRKQLRAPDELAHIIQWAVDGFRMYQEDREAFGKGLIMPKAVEQITKEYLEEQEDGDLVNWVNDRCELGKQFSSKPGDLAVSYSDYIGHEVTANALTRKLKRYHDKFKAEYRRKRWEGIAVREGN